MAPLLVEPRQNSSSWRHARPAHAPCGDALFFFSTPHRSQDHLSNLRTGCEGGVRITQAL